MSCRNAARLQWSTSSRSSAAISPAMCALSTEVLEHVLSVRGPVAQRAQHRDQRRVQVGDADLGHRVLRGPEALRLDLALAALVHLFDPGGMDPPVLDQLDQGQPRRLAPHRVEAGQQHRLRGVVDHHVDAGDLLEGPDVAALAADDAALHLVAGQVHGGHDRFRGLLGGDALDGADHDVLGPRTRPLASACRSMSRATRTACRLASCSTAATSSAFACSAVSPATRSRVGCCSKFEIGQRLPRLFSSALSSSNCWPRSSSAALRRRGAPRGR